MSPQDAEARLGQLLIALDEFRKTRGVHEGEHHYNTFTTCSRCEESYVHAEKKLDEAIALAVPAKESKSEIVWGEQGGPGWGL